MTRMDRVAFVHARIGWKALTAAEYLDEGYAFLSTPNIKSESINFVDVNFVSQFRFKESPELQLKLDDVLLAKDGSTLGIVNLVRSLPRPATVNGSIAVLRPREYHGRFLMYWLKSHGIQSRIQQLKDGMGVPHLFQADIRKLPVPDLSQTVQRRIADFLDDRVAHIDRIIAARREHLALGIDRTSTSLTLRTTEGDGPARETGIPWMPRVNNNWGLPRMSHVFRIGSGSTPPSDNPSYYDGDIAWVNTADVRDGRIEGASRSVTRAAVDEFPTLVQYPAGSLVLAMYGQGATKGRVGLLQIAACVNQACCVLQGSSDLTTWAFYWFKSHKKAIVQLALGAGQPNLSQDIVRALRLPLPPRADRTQLVERMAEDEAATATLKRLADRQIELLTEYKSSLITAAVTGELDVTTAGSGIPG